MHEVEKNHFKLKSRNNFKKKKTKCITITKKQERAI